jgi:hypothetical protein
MFGMHKIKPILLASLLQVIFLFIFVIQVHAAECIGTMTDFGCLPSDPVGFVEAIYTWGLMLISFVAIIFIIIGGYFIMASRGDPEKIQLGKSFIYYSIAGVLLAILGFVFIEIVTGQILKIPGFE